MITIKGLGKWILPAYKPYLLDYKTRCSVFYGGAGSGKSYFVLQKVLIKALQYKRKVLIIRKVDRTIKNSTWALFRELLTKMPEVVEKENKSEYTITLKNGSEFLFQGLDDAEKVKSIHGITDIVIEEASELTAEDFDQLDLRLRAESGMLQMALMFNPVSKANWTYKRFFENGAPEDTRIIQTTYKDNPHLPEEYIKALLGMKQRNPAFYKIYALGQFATLDKLVFPSITVRLISDQETEGLPFWAGMDFGYTNDPTALNWGFVDNAERKLYIKGEYDKRGMTNDIIAETITNLGLAKEEIIADSAEPKSIAELRKLGVRRIKASVKGPDSVKNGIDRLQRYEIIVDERCPKTIEEFENYTWQKDRKSGEYINQPIDAYNHHIDAIRYGTQTAMQKRVRTAEEIKQYSKFL